MLTRMTEKQFPAVIFTCGLVYLSSFLGLLFHGPETSEKKTKEPYKVEDRQPATTTGSIVTGLPCKSAQWSVLTFLINVLLCLCTFDMTFRTSFSDGAQDLSFARVGYVSENSAKIFVREPDSSQFPVQLNYRFADPPADTSGRARLQSGTWKYADVVHQADEESDYTFVRTIKGLSPDTRYQFGASDKHKGFFVTAPKPGEVSKRRGSTGQFTFLHSSCVKARFPYNPFADPLTVPGFSKLAHALESLKPAFMLFLGDFIYIDVPRRHGSDVDHYRREYRQVYASPEWPSVASLQSHRQTLDNYDSYSLSWLHVYDDHEIANDWDANTTGYYPAAFNPYNHYHIAANPPTYRKLDPAALANPAIPPTEKKPYFMFTQGLASFFMIDTRVYRTPPDTPESTILGADQLSDLLSWIARPEPRGIRWKILVSSVPFTKNWRTNAQDTWRGYLAERRIILEAMWNVNAQAQRSEARGTGIIVLSGDRHEFAATAFPPPEDNDMGWTSEASVHEFSASPLSMFYLPVRTYKQDRKEDAAGERDECIKYIPDGNSKFGVVDIEPESVSGLSVLKYRLFVDGHERWSHNLTAPGSR